MSLVCIETKIDIEFGDVLMALSREDIPFYSAVSQDVLRHVPDSDRSSIPRKPWEGGVNVHFADSTKNFNSSYTVVGFTIGKFAYSVSHEVAKRCFPRFMDMVESDLKKAS